MKLAIICDCVHTKTEDGHVGSSVHIFVRQMEALSVYFSEVHLFCPFESHNEKIVITTYTKKNFKFYPLKNVGGNTLLAKLKIISTIPSWFKAFNKANEIADVVYQRFPNNLNIPGFFYFFFKQTKVFATYTGTWDDNIGQSTSYIFQKWLLKKFYKGPVGVYSNKILPKHLFNSFSPSYSLAEWHEETEQIENRINLLRESGLAKLKLISVGSFIAYKNQQYILETCVLLKKAGIAFHLYLVGDGELRNMYENFIENNQLVDQVTLTGKLNYENVRKLYRESNFVVQAPYMEGFGKVPLEGYFHGALPIINNISMAGFITKYGSLGYTFDATIKDSLFNILNNLHNNPSQVIDRIELSRNFVKQFTLESWAKEYSLKLNEYYPSSNSPI